VYQTLLPTTAWTALNDAVMHATNQRTLQHVMSMLNDVTEPKLGETGPDHAKLQKQLYPSIWCGSGQQFERKLVAALQQSYRMKMQTLGRGLENWVMLQCVCASLCSMICSKAYSIVCLSAAQAITQHSNGLGAAVGRLHSS